MKYSIFLLPVFCLFFCAQSFGQDIKFPLLEAENLNGKRAALPKDLPGNPTVVLVAFESDHQADIDLWIGELGLKKSDEIKWIELAVIGSKFRLLRKVIDGGMRSGITSEEDRARTITVYSSRSHFLENLGLTEVDRVYAIVVQQDGGVRAVVEGKPTEEKKQSVMAALKGE